MTSATTMRGIAAMLLAMVMFITNDLFLKLATADLPVGEVLALRSLAAATLLFVIVLVNGDIRAARQMLRWNVTMRSGLDALTTFSYVMALSVLPIAITTSGYMVAPLITTALAVPMLGEKVGFKRWCAIVIGFVGALIVTRPDLSSFQILVVLPLLAAVFGSVRDISTRNISMAVPGTLVALSSAICLTLVGVVFMSQQPIVAPSGKHLAYIVGSGLTFGVGNILLIYAFRNAPVPAVSPLRYVLVPFALLYGFLFFGHLPDLWATVGMVLVVGAGLYSISQEAVRTRRAAKAEAAAELSLRTAARVEEAAAALRQTLPRPAGCGAPMAGAITRSPPQN